MRNSAQTRNCVCTDLTKLPVVIEASYFHLDTVKQDGKPA